MFRRCPFVAVIVYIDLNDVLIWVGVIKHHLDALICSQHRQDAKSLQPGIGAEQLIERSIFEGDVLHARVLVLIGIGERPDISKRTMR